MCGRYSLIKKKQELQKRFGVQVQMELFPQYNIAPQQDVVIIRNTSPGEITLARWGLLPHWARDETLGYKMINARAETVAERPSFRQLIRSQRCLIPADGFYEWQKAGKQKQPFRVTLKDEGMFAMAGLWDVWRNGEREITTCSIITTAANTLMLGIHERMPVILPPEDEKLWLENRSLEEVLALLKPFEALPLAAYPISTLVNSAAHNDPDIIRPL